MSIPEELWRRFQEGDPRALARALTLVESGHPAGRELLKRVRGKGRAKVVGVTGSPGAGKSTLTDRLILEARKRGERVAVLAVDPSSPFSGGAILGDRIRMMRHHQDPGVYIRSMASRGALGGLAGATVAAGNRPRLESVEGPLLEFGLDAAALVGDPELQLPACLLRSHADGGTAIGEADGVGEEVRETQMPSLGF